MYTQSGSQWMSRNHCSSYDTHNFLGIIQPMSDTKQCRRNQLQSFEPDLCTKMGYMPASVHYEQGKQEGYSHSDERSQKYERSYLKNNRSVDSLKSVRHNCRTGKSSNQSMGGR